MKKLLFLSCLLLATCYFSSAAAETIYSNNFEDPVDFSNWDNTNLASNSHGGFASTQYHGNYTQNESTTLTLTGLGEHTDLTLGFDLYLFWTWDGNDTYWGKDYFSLAGDINQSWTFTNHQTEGQSYPGDPNETYGSGSTQTHVYRNLGFAGAGDGFTIAHTGDTFSITFGGPTTQSDEWWGIDNVVVSTNASPVPEPSTMILFGFGLLGLAGIIRRKR